MKDINHDPLLRMTTLFNNREIKSGLAGLCILISESVWQKSVHATFVQKETMYSYLAMFLLHYFKPTDEERIAYNLRSDYWLSENIDYSKKVLFDIYYLNSNAFRFMILETWHVLWTDPRNHHDAVFLEYLERHIRPNMLQWIRNYYQIPKPKKP